MKRILFFLSFVFGVLLLYYISNQIIKSKINDDYLLIKNDINLIFDGKSEIIDITYKKPVCEDSKGVPWKYLTSKSYSLISGIPCRINAKWNKGVHVPVMTSLYPYSGGYSGCKSGCGDAFSSYSKDRDKITRVWNCDQGSLEIYQLIKSNNDEFHLITQASDDISFEKYNSGVNYDYILDLHESLLSFYKNKDSYIPNKFWDIFRFKDEDIETRFHKIQENESSRGFKPHHSSWYETSDYYGSKIYLDYIQESYRIVTKDDDIKQAILSKFYLFSGVLIFLYLIFGYFCFIERNNYFIK